LRSPDSDHPHAPYAARLHAASSWSRDERPDASAQDRGEPQPLRFRSYPGCERVPLPAAQAPVVSLAAALEARRSARAFAQRPVALAAAARLLQDGYGARELEGADGEPQVERSSPSAGGLGPLELSLVAARVDGLAPGVYHYDARAHALELRRLGDPAAALAACSPGQSELLAEAALTIAIGAVLQRTTWRYGERGYRYVWLEAGHVAQTLLLCATALGLASVELGAFLDDELAELLRLPAGEELPLCLVCAGHAS
jgi:SagB-type dehydrogenase family enzyme